jgi:hypothetical protein
MTIGSTTIGTTFSVSMGMTEGNFAHFRTMAIQRGLALVEAVSDRWDTDSLRWGKRAWAECAPEALDLTLHVKGTGGGGTGARGRTK